MRHGTIRRGTVKQVSGVLVVLIDREGERHDKNHGQGYQSLPFLSGLNMNGRCVLFNTGMIAVGDLPSKVEEDCPRGRPFDGVH